MTSAEFWDGVHARCDMAWIGGHDPAAVLQIHGYFPTGKVVADVGVGDGSMSHHLASLGNDVIAVDISNVALGRSCGISILLPGPVPACDLAIVHCVAQHLVDEEFVYLLSALHRCTEISMQVAHGTLPAHERLISRTREQYEALVTRAGKHVKVWLDGPVFDAVSWSVAKI